MTFLHEKICFGGHVGDDIFATEIFLKMSRTFRTHFRHRKCLQMSMTVMMSFSMTEIFAKLVVVGLR